MVATLAPASKRTVSIPSLKELTSFVVIHLSALTGSKHSSLTLSIARHCVKMLNALHQESGESLIHFALRRATLANSPVVLIGEQDTLVDELARAHEPMPKSVHAWSELATREKEIAMKLKTPSCKVWLNGPRTLGLADICHQMIQIVLADISPEYSVEFESELPEHVAFANELATRFNLQTMSDWIRFRRFTLKPGSDLCPHCGHETLKEPVLYCSECGENPGSVYERAGGPFIVHSP